MARLVPSDLTRLALAGLPAAMLWCLQISAMLS
jgi:hypothetical protein